MELYLFRHAIAEPESADKPDEARALTPEGEARMKASVEGLQALGVTFDILFHSPRLRSRQTAEILAPLVEGGEGSLVETPLLWGEPEEGLLKLFENAGDVGDDRADDIAVVGHEPFINQLLAWLVTGEKTLGTQFEFKQGTVACMEGEPFPRKMVLTEILKNKVLRNIG